MILPDGFGGKWTGVGPGPNCLRILFSIGEIYHHCLKYNELALCLISIIFHVEFTTRTSTHFGLFSTHSVEMNDFLDLFDQNGSLVSTIFSIFYSIPICSPGKRDCLNRYVVRGVILLEEMKISAPGRILLHLDGSPKFTCSSVSCSHSCIIVVRLRSTPICKFFFQQNKQYQFQ